MTERDPSSDNNVDEFEEIIGSFDQEPTLFSLDRSEQQEFLADVQERHRDEMFETGMMGRLMEVILRQTGGTETKLDPDKQQFALAKSADDKEKYVVVHYISSGESQTESTEYIKVTATVPDRIDEGDTMTLDSPQAGFRSSDVKLVTDQLNELDELRAMYLPLMDDTYSIPERQSKAAKSARNLNANRPDPYKFFSEEDQQQY